MSLDRSLSRRMQLKIGRYRILDGTLRALARHGPAIQIALWTSLLLPGSSLDSRIAAWVRTWGALGIVSALVFGLRTLAPRARPFVAGHAQALLAREPGPSLPSRHTASAVAMALCALPAAPFRGRLMLAIAAAMGLARVYCGLHFPSDVVVGAALGVLATRMTRAGRLGWLKWAGTFAVSSVFLRPHVPRAILPGRGGAGGSTV